MPVTVPHINNIKDKIIISIDAVKAFEKTKFPFLLKKKKKKNFNKVIIGGT